MRFFVLLSAFGLVASAVAHFSTFAGVDPQQVFPAVWLLHIGIFIVFIPAVATQNSKRSIQDKKSAQFGPLAPVWMKKLTGALFMYMFINFAIFIYMMSGGSPSQRDGGYVLQSHGKVIRQISEHEYHRYRAYEVRGLSGHWMAFYSIAMTILASAVSVRKAAAKEILPTAIRIRNGGVLPIWVHLSILVVGSMFGFFTGPAMMIFAMTRFNLRSVGCGEIIWWLATPFIGLAIAQTVLMRLLPAKCPACGGRTFCVSMRPQLYRCQDCSYVVSGKSN
jgi:hypothetical protein